jgi:FG-GAP-like repeat
MLVLSCLQRCRWSCAPALLSLLLLSGQAFAQVFGSPTFFPVSSTNSNPQAILLGDLNGDGNLDLVVGSACADAQCDQGIVSVFLGNGDGTFQSPTTYLTDFAPSAFALADFNGDGKLDVVVVNRCVYYPGGCLVGGSVQVFLGNGDGTFPSPESTGIGGFLGLPVGIAVADFNGDGKPDLALTYIAGGVIRYTDSGFVLLGNGDGTFGEAVPFLGSQKVDDPLDLVAGDFNGDGKMDLAVIASRWGNVDILLGNGDGTFLPWSSFRTGHGVALTAADINGDGHLDLATTDAVGVRLAYGNGDGTFAPPTGLNTAPGASPHRIITGDFNGDGRVDLAVALSSVDPTIFVVYINQLNGKFQKQFFAASGRQLAALAAGDLNHDGALDLVVLDSQNNDVGVFLNAGGASATR